jgi:hypothetical protein
MAGPSPKATNPAVHRPDTAIRASVPASGRRPIHGHPTATLASALTNAIRAQRTHSPGGLEHKAETVIVVAVVGVVPVAVGGAQVVVVVVPGTAAQHTADPSDQSPRLKTVPEKMALRKPSVSPWRAWLIQACIDGSMSASSSLPPAYNRARRRCLRAKR